MSQLTVKKAVNLMAQRFLQLPFRNTISVPSTTLPIRVTLIPGNGIGPEITSATKAVVERARVPIIWEETDPVTLEETELGEIRIASSVLKSIQRNGVVIKGPFHRFTNHPDSRAPLNAVLRQNLGLYVTVQFSGKNQAVFVNENNLQAVGVEHEVVKGQIIHSSRVTTQADMRRFAQFTFQFAQNYNKKVISLIHKNDTMKMTSKLMLDEFFTVTEDFPNIALKLKFLHTYFYELIRGKHFDVIAAPNSFSESTADSYFIIEKSLGISPSISLGDDIAVFETVHGTADELKNKNLANPIGMIMSASLMLRFLGLHMYGAVIEDATRSILNEGLIRTFDMGGTATTTEITDAICDRIPASSKINKE